MLIEFQPQDGFLQLVLEGNCTSTGSISLFDEFEKSFKATGLKNLLVQCENCGSMDSSCFRDFGQIARLLKSVNGKICLINVSPDVQKQISVSGMTRILTVKLSLRGAFIDFGLTKVKDFDVNFLNPFIEATQKTLSVQCQINSIAQKPYLKKPDEASLFGDISGIIGIVSETFTGVMAISFNEKFFLTMANRVLQEDHFVVEKNIVDLAGEISNIILGLAKTELNKKGYQIKSALPSCVWGKDHRIKHLSSGPCIIIPFSTEIGTFHIEITSENKIIPSTKSNT